MPELQVHPYQVCDFIHAELDRRLCPVRAQHQLDVVANRIFAANRAADIVVDMEKCAYVSSAGLRVIIAMQKRTSAGGSLRFCNVSAGVMDVFVSTGFDTILSFE